MNFIDCPNFTEEAVGQQPDSFCVVQIQLSSILIYFKPNPFKFAPKKFQTISYIVKELNKTLV